jgi:hypothetical protein
MAVVPGGCGNETTDVQASLAADPAAATATPTPTPKEASVLADPSGVGDEPMGQEQAAEVVDRDLIEFGFGVSEEQLRLIDQVKNDGVAVVASTIVWDEPDSPVLVVYVSEPWDPPADAFEFPIRVVEAEAVDEASLTAALDAWFASGLGQLIAVGSSLDLIPPGGLELGIDERYQERVEVRTVGHVTEIRLLPDGDEPVPEPLTLTVPVTTFFSTPDREEGS